MTWWNAVSTRRRSTKHAAARIGPAERELAGPIPTETRSNTLMVARPTAPVGPGTHQSARGCRTSNRECFAQFVGVAETFVNAHSDG